MGRAGDESEIRGSRMLDLSVSQMVLALISTRAVRRRIPRMGSRRDGRDIPEKTADQRARIREGRPNGEEESEAEEMDGVDVEEGRRWWWRAEMAVL